MKINGIFFTLLLTIIGWSTINGQVTHVNSQSNQVAGASLTITRPAGLQVGDLMIINLNIREGGATPSTVPTGWVQRASYDHASPNRWVWIGYKVAVAADVSAANFTFVRTGASSLAGAISAFRNVLTTTNGGIDVVGTSYNADNVGPIAPPSITTVDNNNLVLFLGQVQSIDFNGTNGWRLGGAAGTEMTELYAVNPGTSICGVGAAILTRPTAGASGVGYKETENGRKAGILLSIKSIQCTVNASVSKVDAVCGGSNGSITLSSPSGGSGSYQYRLDAGAWQVGASFTGLAAGTYSVQIRDTNNTSCAITLGNQTIASGALQATVSKTDQVCGTNGTITFSAPTGGGGTYQYRLNSGAWQSSGSFTNLAPGSYSPQIRDAANISCTATLAQVTIAALPGTDSDGDGVPNDCDQDDDNDGILDINEDVTDFLESWETNPLRPTINGNNIGGSTFGSWSTQNNLPINIIRVNGAGYASGADNAVSGSQYLDIVGSDFPIYPFTVTGTSTVTASAWFSNRETNVSGYTPWNARLEVLNSTFAVVASGPIIPFTSSVSMETWLQTSVSTVISTPGQYYIRIFVADYGHADDIRLRISSDADGDTFSNQLDNDSDNDGCFDAIEGGGNFTLADLDANGRLTGGVNAFGVPNVALAGQTRGGSYVASQLSVTTPPSNQIVVSPNSTSFTVGVTASNNTSWSGATNARVPVYGSPGNGNAQTLYQWYLGNPDSGGSLLTNGPIYNGVTTATLAISNTAGLFGNEYYVVVSHSNNTCIRQVRNASLLLACTASAPSSTPTLCVNTTLTNITHTTTSATGIGTPTGLPTGVNVALSANVLTLSGAPSQTGVFNYSIPLTGGNCTNQTATGTITVNGISNAGTIAASQTICSGATPVAFTSAAVATGTGTITYQWQNSIDNGTTWNNIATATNATYASGALTQITQFRRLAFGGGCPVAGTASNVVIVTVNTLDTDGDSVPDACDLDDDNDGVSDTDEKNCDVSSRFVAWNHNNGTVFSASNLNNTIVSSALDYTTGSGLTRTLSNSAAFLSNISATTSAQARANDEYLEFVFTTAPSSTFVASTLNAFRIRNQNTQNANVYNVAVDISTNNSPTFTNIKTSQLIPDQTFTDNNFDIPYQLQPSVTYTLRFYFFSTNTDPIFFDDFSFLVCIDPDTDGDGIINALDTDTDNDSCFDAIEGGGSFTSANIDGNGRLTGGVNATTGIPTFAGAGQTVGGSRVSSQLTVTNAPVDQTVATPAATSFTIATTASNNTSWSGAPNFTPVYGTPGNANAQTVYQWWLGNPSAGGTILTNSGVYSGVTTATLAISNTTNLSGNEYYVVVSHSNNSCISEVRSAKLFCVKPGITAGGTQVSSNVGISVMQQNATGPENRNNGHLILEAKTKGFVITRMPTASLPTGAAAVKGMLVYDTTENCLKLYNGTTWGCIAPACPD